MKMKLKTKASEERAVVCGVSISYSFTAFSHHSFLLSAFYSKLFTIHCYKDKSGHFMSIYKITIDTIRKEYTLTVVFIFIRRAWNAEKPARERLLDRLHHGDVG